MDAVLDLTARCKGRERSRFEECRMGETWGEARGGIEQEEEVQLRSTQTVQMRL